MILDGGAAALLLLFTIIISTVCVVLSGLIVSVLCRQRWSLPVASADAALAAASYLVLAFTLHLPDPLLWSAAAIACALRNLAFRGRAL